MIQITPDKPFPPPGYEKERREMLAEALEKAPCLTLKHQLTQAKQRKIKNSLSRAAYAQNLLLDSLVELQSKLKEFLQSNGGLVK